MDNNYFDFLGQNSVAGNDNSNTGSGSDKGKVNLTVRVDADCQVICDGDFLFLANANQIVKDKAPVGQHIMNFTSLDFPDATVEKIVDFPIEGNNYLIVVNELSEKIQNFQKAKEEIQKRDQQLNEAMKFYENGKYSLAQELLAKFADYLNDEQKTIFDKCREKIIKEEYEKTHNFDVVVNGVSFTMVFVKGKHNYHTWYEYYFKNSDAIGGELVDVEDFHISETKVTQGLWKAVMGCEPAKSWTEKFGKGDNYPAYNVSWNDCQEFINKLNLLTGKNFHMPDAFHWEYAACQSDLKDWLNDWEDFWYDNFETCLGNPKPVKTPNSGEMSKLSKFNKIGVEIFENMGEWCDDFDEIELKENSGKAILNERCDNPKDIKKGGINKNVRAVYYFNYRYVCCNRRKYPCETQSERIGFRLAIGPSED